jgi:hypothetical protein
MPRPADAAAPLAALERGLRGAVRRLRRLALAALAADVPLAALLARGGLDALDVVVAAVLLAPPAVLLFFAQGLGELARVPERLRRVPAEGRERALELARLGSELRGARLRRLPLVLWRLRGAIGSVRDVAGIALPLRVLTPGFLGAAAVAALACAGLVAAGAVALVVLAAG